MAWRQRQLDHLVLLRQRGSGSPAGAARFAAAAARPAVTTPAEARAQSALCCAAPDGDAKSMELIIDGVVAVGHTCCAAMAAAALPSGWL